MAERFYTLAAEGITAVVDLEVGHIRTLRISIDGATLEPLHTAPWIEEPAIVSDASIDPGLKYLSGDFFCAPFCASDVEEAPGHGWPANAPWSLVSDDEGDGVSTARFVLSRPVMGATLYKELILRDGHPFIYQRHVFEGGSGAVSAASHAITRFVGSGHLSFSPKAFGELPETQQEPDPARGNSVFAHPARFTDLSHMPLENGSTVDLHDYPVAEEHEDFVMLVEDKGSQLGWTTALRPASGDIMLSLKNPADFPVTFLWYSNGGRFYPPWNGRHRGVLGIEEGRSNSLYGHAASVAPNPLSDAGIPTSVTLKRDGSVALHHVIGGIPLPDGWDAVAAVTPGSDSLNITGNDGEHVEYPFDRGFLAEVAHDDHGVDPQE